ncbi:hypothetical protein HEB94_005968 [Actinopolymorpha pittospori]|uniref:Uncharacterized protein n=1 Tax=Actinopolymorpha pittospori TaxID=648752 RepID=A0A927REE9_9ACTN|nr:hypothetical protein [Actinopolymorpha pittospori]
MSARKGKQAAGKTRLARIIEQHEQAAGRVQR